MNSYCVEYSGWGHDEADVERDIHWHEGADSHEPRQRLVAVRVHRGANNVRGEAELVLLSLRHIHFVAASFREL